MEVSIPGMHPMVFVVFSGMASVSPDPSREIREADGRRAVNSAVH